MTSDRRSCGAVQDTGGVADAIREAIGPQLDEPGSRFCVALSGGLDSSVLLHALAALAPGRVRAVYVNHQLQPDAALWAEHCAQLCLLFGVPFAGLTVKVDPGHGHGPEAAARQARYLALGAELRPGEVLVTAHHEGDQAETVLLNLCRGSGPAGLAGIPARGAVSGAVILRPLLRLPKAALLAYGRRAGFSWLEDPSNMDQRMDRNFLRHHVIPALGTRWPGAGAAIARSARWSAEAAGLLEDLAALDARRVLRKGRILVAALACLSEARQRNLLRYLCRRELGSVPPEARLREGLAQMLSAGADRSPLLSWSGGEIRRYKGALYLMRPFACRGSSAQPVTVMPCRAGARLDLGAAHGRIVLVRARGRGLALSRLGSSLEIAFRSGGERLQPQGAGTVRELKKLLQERAVVPWMRSRIPLLYSRGTLVAVADLWLAREAAATDGESALRVRWEDHPPVF